MVIWDDDDEYDGDEDEDKDDDDNNKMSSSIMLPPVTGLPFLWKGKKCSVARMAFCSLVCC